MPRWRITRTLPAERPSAPTTSGGLLVVEGHHQHRPLAFRQALEAVGDARLVEARRDVQVGHRQVVGVALEQLGARRSPRRWSITVSRQVPSTNDSDPLGLAQLAGAQLLDGVDHDLLHQVGGGVGVAQVAQAVAADPRREQPVELGLGLAAPRPARRRRCAGRARASGVSAAEASSGFHGAKHSQAPREKKSVTPAGRRATTCGNSTPS